MIGGVGTGSGRRVVATLPAVRALAPLAREAAIRQDGVVTTAQLGAWGTTRETVRRRVAAGDWKRLFRGVVVLQSGPVSWRQRARAALLYCGPDAALSHESAAFHHGVLREPGRFVVVTVPHARTVTPQPGLVVHRSRAVPWSGGRLRAVEPAEAVLQLIVATSAAASAGSPDPLRGPTGPGGPARAGATGHARTDFARPNGAGSASRAHPDPTEPARTDIARPNGATSRARTDPTEPARTPVTARASRGRRDAAVRSATTDAPAPGARDVTDAVVGLLCDAVRAGVHPDDLLVRAQRRTRMAGRRLLVEMLGQVAQGVESPLEHRYARDVERRHGLPHAVAQRWERVDGRWIRADRVYAGLGVRAELDGRLAHPFGATDDDVWRDNATLLATSDTTLRYRWRHVAVMPCATAAQVARALRDRGWPGSPQPCSATCPLTP